LRVPTKANAAAMPLAVSELSKEAIAILGNQLRPGAAPAATPLSRRPKASALRVPARETAAAMPLAQCELPEEVLVVLSERGCHDACAERLVRNIMSVDGVDWAAAREKLLEISAANRKVEWMMTLPHKLGVSVAAVSGIACAPLVFSGSVAEWFNQRYVTTAVPKAEDLETMLEVGIWTWQWMEPVLGTVSFALIAFKFVRAQMLNMNLMPYTTWVHDYRSRRLASLFPRYNVHLVRDYARTSSLTPLSLR